MYNPEIMAVKKALKCLAVDWGSKRIGLAVSDPNGTIARQLCVFSHISREADAGEIVKIALENSAERIVVGVTYDDENELSPSGRSAKRLADVISNMAGCEVILWDEAFSTLEARRLQIEKGVKRSKRKGHQDSLSAALILQDYLEKNNP